MDMDVDHKAGAVQAAPAPAASPADTVDGAFTAYLHDVEGGEQHRGKDGLWRAYNTDGAGKWTIGRGHLINGGKSPKGFEGGLTDDEVEQLFQADVLEAVNQARNTIGPETFDALPKKDRQLFTDFSFNLGPKWAEKFPSMTAAVLAGDREKAKAESARFMTTPGGDKAPLKHRNKQAGQYFFGQEPEGAVPPLVVSAPETEGGFYDKEPVK